MHVLVTGGAGFIGSHVVEALLTRGDAVTVLDNFDDGYDPALKRENVARFAEHVRLVEGDLRDPDAVRRALVGVEAVAHFAARAGVRPSIARPSFYVDNNVRGTQALLDGMRDRGVDRLVYASSSSVYGARTEGPFREDDPVRAPESPYAATKMACELMIHAATRSSDLRASCVRLFTVYGPRQRPEMAIHLFARLALTGGTITRFGAGGSLRDYTFVGDIARGALLALDNPRPFRVYNLGFGAPIRLSELLEQISEAFGVELNIVELPDQPGDVPLTWSDTSRAREELGYEPRTSLVEGLRVFGDWLSRR